MEEKDFLYELAAEIVEEILNKVLRKSSFKRKLKELWTPNKKPKARDSLGALLSSAPKKQHKLTAEKQKQYRETVDQAHTELSGKKSKVLVKLDDQLKTSGCGICQQSLRKDFRRLMCKHKFHVNCILSYFKQKTGCPLCKAN